VKIGYLLLTAGFLFGAYATALDVRATDWSLFVPAAVAALLGLILVKRSSHGAARADHVLTANRADLESSLAGIVANLDAMIAERDATATDDWRLRIDTRLRDDLRRFADARESMVHLFGMQTYANIMSDFAAGERSVNRVWSASTDGYGDEASLYLERARDRFGDAKKQFDYAVGSS